MGYKVDDVLLAAVMLSFEGQPGHSMTVRRLEQANAHCKCIDWQIQPAKYDHNLTSQKMRSCLTRLVFSL